MNATTTTCFCDDPGANVGVCPCACHRIDPAKVAGYEAVDTPSEPRRSAYTDDIDGDVAYARECGRWAVYQALVAAPDRL